MTASELIKKHYKSLLVVAALVFAAMISIRACDITDRYSVAIGEYKALAARAKADRALIEKENKFLIRHMNEKDMEIVRLEGELSKNKDKIAAIAADQRELESVLALAKTDAERVPILTDLVSTWKARYAELEAVVVNKDAQIAALQVKWADMNKIAENYKQLWMDEAGKNAALLDANKALAGQLRVARIGGKAKTILIAAASAYVIYGMIKK